MQAQRAGFALGPSPSPTLHLARQRSLIHLRSRWPPVRGGPEPQAVFITNEHPAYPLLRRNSEWETGRKERPASRSQSARTNNDRKTERR